MQDTWRDNPRSLPSDREIHAFHTAARDLIGIALRSLEVAGDGISLPKFRMMMTMSELGRCASVRVARALGVSASSVTRLGDRLVEEGYVARGADEHSRSVVTLELTRAGQRLIDRVVTWRHDELSRLLAQLEPGLRAYAAEALDQFAEAAAGTYGTAPPGPVAL